MPFLLMPFNTKRLLPKRLLPKRPLRTAPNLLAWPAWLRMAAAAPVVLCLWLAVAWASLEAMPW